MLCLVLLTYHLGSQDGWVANLCKFWLGWSEYPLETSYARCLVSGNWGNQIFPPFHLSNQGYYHLHLPACFRYVVLFFWVTKLVKAEWLHQVDPVKEMMCMWLFPKVNILHILSPVCHKLSLQLFNVFSIFTVFCTCYYIYSIL